MAVLRLACLGTGPRVSLLLELGAFLLFVFNECNHLAAAVFQHDELLVLVLHVFLLLAVPELELTKLFLLLAQLFVEFCDLLVVVAFLVEGL